MDSCISGGNDAPVTTDHEPSEPDRRYAELLRRLAELLDAGAVEYRSDPVAGALLDAVVGTMRCIVIAANPASATLSPREAEVATMVARGLTNRAIATALDISLWTVATHLRRIFAKLGVNNRAEMVALVCWSPANPNSRTRHRAGTAGNVGPRSYPHATAHVDSLGLERRT
jgi:DNA-binding CsgD family transcriptional regulator